MKKTLLYVNGDLKNRVFIHTGIGCQEFFDAVKENLNNILLLKGDFMGDDCLNHFELFEKKETILALIKEQSNRFGDFCYVDYKDKKSLTQLSPQDAAELLYLAHMFKPLDTPFIKCIENNYVYLSHDDSFFVKLYCKKSNDYAAILAKKLETMISRQVQINPIDAETRDTLLSLTEGGLLIDFDKAKCNGDKYALPIFMVGKYENMDIIYHEHEKLTINSNFLKILTYTHGHWRIERGKA